MNRFVRIFVAVAIALAGCAPFAWDPVSAHRAVTIPPYRFVAGWLEEPAIAGALNGLDLEVELNRTPVLDAHENLTVSLTKGSASISPSLVPQFGRPGRYTFVVIPTEAGNYSLRVTGNLNGTAIDFTVDLDEVVTPSDLQLPRLPPTSGDLQGQVATLLVVATIGLVLAGISTAMLLLPKLPKLLLRRRT